MKKSRVLSGLRGIARGNRCRKLHLIALWFLSCGWCVIMQAKLLRGK